MGEGDDCIIGVTFGEVYDFREAQEQVELSIKRLILILEINYLKVI